MPLEDDTLLLVGIPDCADAEDNRFVSDIGGEVAERLVASRVLGIGREGRGPVGGLSDGRGGRMVVAIFFCSGSWSGSSLLPSCTTPPGYEAQNR